MTTSAGSWSNVSGRGSSMVSSHSCHLLNLLGYLLGLIRNLRGHTAPRIRMNCLHLADEP